MKSAGQRHRRRPQPIVLEDLENRVQFSQIFASAHGAVPNDGRDDRTAVLAALNAARSGDTVVFGDGVYNFDSQISLKTGVNVTSAAPLGATLVFAVSKDGNGWAFRGNGVRDITFSNLAVRSNNG